MEIEPRVSIIMAAFNAERFVGEAVESILQQSFRDFELLVIDDGSTDHTRGVLNGFSDARLCILSQNNQGLTRSLIRGAAAARGHCLARQDADDISEPSRLEAQVAYLDEHPEVALVGTFASVIDEDGVRIGVRHLETNPGIEHGNLAHENQFVHGSLMMRTAAYHDVGGYRSFFRYSQDYDLVLRIAERWGTANIGEEYYRHRMRADEVSILYNRQQERYRDAARTLHRERRAGRMDSLDAGRLAADEPAPGDDAGNDNHVDAYRVRYIYTCLRSGKLLEARREILRRLKQKPIQPKSYLHLTLTFLDRRAVVEIFKAWDRIRNTRHG